MAFLAQLGKPLLPEEISGGICWWLYWVYGKTYTVLFSVLRTEPDNKSERSKN